MLLRATITKGEQIRYISHLDFARTVERALRRAKLPVAYSEGFNPHVKLSFASALSLGVIGLQEYFDVELTSEIDEQEFVNRLSSVLPKGVSVGRAVKISDRHKALMAVINYSTYTVELPLAGIAEQAQAAIEKFNSAAAVHYTRVSPKGRRQIDIKQFVQQPILADISGGTLVLSFAVAITPGGSVKASEIIEALAEQFALPAERDLALIRREGLWIKQGDDLISPLELRG